MPRRSGTSIADLRWSSRFNHEEAVRSFQRAAELDPSAAMPHWGIAWALGPNYNLDIDDPRARQAFEAIERARTLAKAAPAVEREYIEAMAVRYSAESEGRPRGVGEGLQPGDGLR